MSYENAFNVIASRGRFNYTIKLPGGRSAATDAFTVLVAVSDLGTDVPKAPDIDRLLSSTAQVAVTKCGHASLTSILDQLAAAGEPKLVPSLKECPECDGEGECPHCGHECRNCDGDGKVEDEDGPMVPGSVWEVSPGHGSISFDGVSFSAPAVLPVLRELPDTTTVYVFARGPREPVEFRCSDWIFLVMPRARASGGVELAVSPGLPLPLS